MNTTIMTREEAIERVRQWSLPKETMEVLKVLAPELKESEDERIRKRIRLCLDECVHSDIIRDYERDECLAYLEKQKESPKSADFIPSDCISDAKCENLHNEEGDFVFELRQIISSHRYSDIYGEYTNDEEGMASEILELCKCELEKQKEQKPMDLEKELQAFLCNYDYEFDDDAPAYDIAKHFYELGLKARKEE